MRYRKVGYSTHALDAMEERRILKEWIERLLDDPAWVQQEHGYLGRFRAFGRVPEHGDRMLRVVYDEIREGICIVTVFFDRAHRNR